MAKLPMGDGEQTVSPLTAEIIIEMEESQMKERDGRVPLSLWDNIKFEELELILARQRSA